MKKKHAAVFGEGVSIKTLTVVLVLAAVLALAASFIEATETITNTAALYSLEEERQICDSAIQSLIDGSDYLTSQIEQYVIKGDRHYMDNYWCEAEKNMSREHALETVLSSNVTESERNAALASKSESDALMVGETWAMRMVAESMGMPVEDMPARVAGYTLSASDSSLSAKDKQAAAIAYVFGADYAKAKGIIRDNVVDFRNEISARYTEEAMVALDKSNTTSWQLEVFMILFFIILILAVALFAKLTVLPLIAFSMSLKSKSGDTVELDETHGALEIKRFACAFNELYKQVLQNTEHLRRLGYYDYLTDVPNRASITEYVEAAISENAQFGLMIMDIDNFKRFNDTYGHAIGDRTLQAVAKMISAALNSDSDGIAGRLCGEEFILVEKDISSEQMRSIAEQALENVCSIKAADVGLSPNENFSVTVSIGGMLYQNAEEGANFTRLLSKADKALYVSKTTGKNKYSEFLT